MIEEFLRNTFLLHSKIVAMPFVYFGLKRGRTTPSSECLPNELKSQHESPWYMNAYLLFVS